MDTLANIDTSVVARTAPPAKLNLFLELLARRDDGYHEIDTVMVAIDWRDELQLSRIIDRSIELSVDWIPSRQAVAREMGFELDDESAVQVLEIPTGQANLVHQALDRFRKVFQTAGGFRCDLRKSIPAGAGMGGASSDAASALRCAAMLCGIDPQTDKLVNIANEIGSDVAFFLGAGEFDQPITAARATGRGEKIEPIEVASQLNFVVAFPSLALSTALVYANSQIPAEPTTADGLIAALETGNLESLQSTLLNRLTIPAKKLAPQIGETIESMWRQGARPVQLTGSGSACFAITSSSKEAAKIVQQIRREINGIRATAARSATVPTEVELMSRR